MSQKIEIKMTFLAMIVKQTKKNFLRKYVFLSDTNKQLYEKIPLRNSKKYYLTPLAKKFVQAI